MPRISNRNVKGSLAFNGSSTVVTIPNSSSINTITTSATVGMWIFRNTDQSSVDEYLLVSGAKWYYRIDSLTSGLLRFYYNGSNSIFNGPRLKKGVWQHVVTTLSYNGSNITGSIYINGVLFGTQNQPGTTVEINGNSINIGNPSNSLNGKIQDFCVWNRALTSTEVSSLYFSNVVPTTGLVTRQLLSEMTGTTANDTSGNGNNGTITAGTWSTDRPFADRNAVQNINSSLYFSGSTQYVQLANPSNFTNQTFTQIARIKPSSNGGMAIFGSSAGGIEFRTNANGSLELLQQVVVSVATSSTGLIKKNTWQDVAVTYDASGNYAFYLNGQLIGSGTNLRTWTFGGSVQIGGATAAPEYFTGNISTALIYNRALSASEILSAYNTQVYPTTGLLTYQKFTEGAGTTVYDSSGNGNNGTITGATWSSDTPSRARKIVGGNMIPNGDFSYVPVVNVAQTPSGNWIDGTSTGSTTNNLFGWSFIHDISSGSVVFDKTVLYNTSPSIKITATTKGAGTYIFADATLNLSSTGNWNSPGAIRCSPNTSYTFTAYIKTSGAGTSQGARLFIQTKQGSNTTQTLRSTGGLVIGTQDWTKVTLTFTTGSTDSWIRAVLLAGEGADIVDGMSVWFANISLVPTAQLTATVQSRLPGRKLIEGNNLVKNGDFSFIPTGVIPTSTGGTWIDGTAGGSSTLSQFGWAILTGTFAGSYSALFDSSTKYGSANSLKLSITTAGSTLDVTSMTALNASNLALYAIPVLPNTTYTGTYLMKTNYISGDAVGGAKCKFIERDASNGNTVGNQGTEIKTTTGWTLYTVTFTTASTTRYVHARPSLEGNTGAQTLVMDAWFSNISLVPTSQLTGSIYSRLPPYKLRIDTNLVPNGDFSYVPTATTPTTSSGVWITNTAGGSSTQEEYKFAITNSGTVSALFDTSTKYAGNASLKVSTGAINSWAEIYPFLGETATNVKTRARPVTPGALYTYSFRMKTNLISGTSSDGAFIAFREFDGSGTAVTTTLSTKVVTTTDWTLYTGTITPTSTTRYIYPRISLYGHTGTGTLVMDAWFDEVSIIPSN